MNKLKTLSIQQPLLFTLLLVILSIGALYSNVPISGWVLPLFGANENDIFTTDIFSSIFKNVITIGLLIMIVKFKWQTSTLLNSPYKDWHSKWWLASLPMVLIATLNLTSVEWQLVDFTLSRTVGWLYINNSTGIFEEVLLRGICFYVLYTAWKDQKNGLIKAAIYQAFIFGLAHYVNLFKAPFVEVTIQVTYATLIGIGFAGLVAYTRSLWPAIAIHSIINAAGTMNTLLNPNFVQTEMSIASYVVVIAIIGLICTLPGYILLRKSAKQISNANAATV